MSESREPESETRSDAELHSAHGVLRLRAENAGPFTLSGTNTWIVGRDPTWVIDPGPSAADTHVERILAAVNERGGLGGVALTHDHADHSGALAALLAAHPAPIAAGRGKADVRLADGARFGPLEALASPGHAPDHFAFIGAGACFSGDAVLGEGSVFIAPHEGSLAGYLVALERLRAREDFAVICPGHGPVVWDPRAKIGEYIAHRLERERRLIAALAEGRRTQEELLDAAWSEVPAMLRRAAAVTLAAHLEKLESEGALPQGVQRAATVPLDEPGPTARVAPH